MTVAPAFEKARAAERAALVGYLPAGFPDVDGGIELLHDPPAPGVDLEVHDAPTRHGRIAFALRWHGEHPALLWEVTPAEHRRGRPPVLTVPVLAPGWSSRDAVGETLLRPTGTD